MALSRQTLVRRKSTWQVACREIGEFHAAQVTRQTGWTQAKTAKALNLSAGVISLNLKIYEFLDSLLEYKTSREAYDALLAREEKFDQEVIGGDELDQADDGELGLV